MSLNKISLTTVVKNQFIFKLSENASAFTSLVILQAFGVILALGGSWGGSHSSEMMTIDYNYYSINSVIIFTIIWGVIQSIILGTKTNWEKSFAFVGNRLSNDISNIIFMLVLSVVGGILTIMTDYLLRVLIYYFLTDQALTVNAYALTGQEILSGVIAMVFFLLLFSAFGYFLGTLSRLHQLMSILLPATIIGGLIAIAQTGSNLLIRMSEFYFQETNPSVFIVKIAVTVLLLYFATILISSRTEVKR